MAGRVSAAGRAAHDAEEAKERRARAEREARGAEALRAAAERVRWLESELETSRAGAQAIM
mgnify:CR=1 FL=1